MRPAAKGEVASGSVLAVIVFVIIFSSVPLPVRAATSFGYFFTMTFVVPTSNPSRQQQAAMIAEDLRKINIDVRLVYTTFGTMAELTFGCSSNCGKTYAEGGFDAGIVGLGGGTSLPDFGTQNVLTYRSLNNSDYPPTGANFIFYHNDTYNQLAAQYNTDYNATDRTIIARKMVEIILQDRPDMPIFQPVDIYVVSNFINQWGDHAQESSATANGDFQHWSVSQGRSINIAEPGNISSVNQWVTIAPNNFYDAYLYNPTVARLEEVDGRTLQYTRALVTSIVWSQDDLTWTVSFRPHNFQDGVPVTADDYLFAMMGQSINNVGSVNTGTLQSLLGDYGVNRCNCSGIRFTYLNGTTDFVWGGNYSRQFLTSFITTSTWRALNDTAFQFTLSQPYLFTDPVLTGFGAAPMHIFESVPFAQWETSPFATLHDTPYIYTYNHPGQANHGGNGSGTAYGPIGDGPYYYHGYNSTSKVGTLVKWGGYWNATGLESLGLFNARVVRVIHVSAAEVSSAFQSGAVNFVDSNYFLPPNNLTAMVQANGHLTHQSPPWAGFRVFFLQLRHPVWGTGTGTPNGQKDPAHAAVYARYVRSAISHAIPRQEILDTFYHGYQENPGITEFCTCFAWAYPPGAKPDSFDLNLSMSLLKKAGYSMPDNVATVPIPTTGLTCGSVGTTPPVNVTFPSFVQGDVFTPSGTFGIPVSVGNGTKGFYTTLEESTNNGTSWNPVALTVSTEGGYYSFAYAPTITGSILYRVFFTGIPARSSIGYSGPGPNTPAAVESFAPPLTKITGEAPLNITDIKYGPIIRLQVESTAGLVQDILNSTSAKDAAAIRNTVCGILSSMNAALSNFSDSTSARLKAISNSTVSKADLSNAVNALNGSVTNAMYVSYIALAVAIISFPAIVITKRRVRRSSN